MIQTPILILAAALGWSQETPFSDNECRAAEREPREFTVSVGGLRRLRRAPQALPPPQPVDVTIGLPGDPTVSLERIVNIGHKMWTIVDANKPVVDVHTEYAAAVPQGISRWEDLQGWEPPAGSDYGFSLENAFGARVVEVQYRVMRSTGGSYKGRGHYLTGVTVEPLLVRVAWGYKVTITAGAPTVTNADKTGDDPVAGMTVEVRWRVRTPIQDTQGTAVYFVRGDGLFLEVGGAVDGPRPLRTFARAGGRVRQAAAAVESVDGRW